LTAGDDVEGADEDIGDAEAIDDRDRGRRRRRDNSSKGLIQPGGKILLQIFCRCRRRIRAVQFVVDGSKSGEAIGEPPQTGVARTGTGRPPRPRGSAPLMSWQGAEKCASGCDFTLRDASLFLVEARSGRICPFAANAGWRWC
jgi:hypothetical protein